MKKTIADFAYYGGEKAFPTFKTSINITPPQKDIFFKHVELAFQNRQLTNNGSNVKELEKQLASYHNVKHCICICNSFMSLFLAVKKLALPNKTEVITPSLGNRISIESLRWHNLIPHFCDIDEKTRTINNNSLINCINNNTALILVPQPMVALNDIEKLEEISKEFNIPLLFDSSEAFGTTYKGKILGSFGNAEVFSMDSDKILNGYEGGYICTNDDSLAQQLQLIRNFGFVAYDKVDYLGINAKLNEIHAALALSNLSYLDEQILKNKTMYLTYQQNLQNIPGINIIPYNEKEKQNWKTCLIHLTNQWPLSTELTLKLLNAENINAHSYYSPPLHKIFSEYNYPHDSLHVTEKICDEYILLPLDFSMNIDDIKIVAQLIRNIYQLNQQILSFEQEKTNEKIN